METQTEKIVDLRCCICWEPGAEMRIPTFEDRDRAHHTRYALIAHAVPLCGGCTYDAANAHGTYIDERAIKTGVTQMGETLFEAGPVSVGTAATPEGPCLCVGVGSQAKVLSREASFELARALADWFDRSMVDTKNTIEGST